MISKIKKSVCFVMRENAKTFFIALASAVIEALVPHILVFTIAIIVNELIYNNGKSIPTMMVYGGIILLICTAWREGTNRAYQIARTEFDELMRCRMHTRILDMPYKIFTDAKVQAKIRKSEESYMYNGGFNLLLDYLRDFFLALFTIIISSLSFSLLYISGNNSASVAFLLGGIILLLMSIVFEAFILKKITSFYGKMAKLQMDDVLKGEGLLSYFLFKVFNDYQNGKTIRHSHMQNLIMSKYMDVFTPSVEKNLAIIKTNNTIRILSNLTTRVVCGILYIIIATLSVLGIVSAGVIIYIIGALNIVNESVQRMINELDLMDRHIEQIERYMLFQTDVNKNSNLETVLTDNIIHEIRFNNVGYKYDNSDRWALRNINYTFTFDKKYSIVGENGAGKTTLIGLLLGYLVPTEGEILVNGVKMPIQQKTMINNFCSIFQDFNLYAFSVAQNIACRNKFERNKIERCIAKIGMEEDVNKMVDGIDTILFSYDERGREMSGGEQQKIAIAREDYKQAPIWVLDEPTAALDPKSEAEIYSKLMNEFSLKSCIFVSHRMSSCSLCDEILVFSKGALVANGNHSDLLDGCETYKEMWDKQLSMYDKQKVS